MTAVWRKKSKPGHDIKNIFLPKCFSDHAEQLLPWSTLLKNQVIVSKKGNESINYWKTAKLRL